ncbi:MAG: CBS domain-containing protein [Gammaproteobacteria bacterium]|jgi:signal-transduction protein with cAMP-binding, CBS, and nucleotidyltransferase domain
MTEKTQRPIVRVRDVMKKEFDTVDGLDTIENALKKMKHIGNKCLIVNKRHEDDEYGMLLISDVARKVLAQDKSPDRVNVYEIMAKPVVSVDHTMDVRYCARLFDQFDISRAPVSKNGEVIGIVSFTDLVLKGLTLPS